MARAPRVDVAGYCYHVLNRANARYRMFKKDGDFEAFERVLEQAVARAGPSIELMAYCVMPNHWHLVIRTHEDGAMGAFMKSLTTTHAGRLHKADDPNRPCPAEPDLRCGPHPGPVQNVGHGSFSS